MNIMSQVIRALAWTVLCGSAAGQTSQVERFRTDGGNGISIVEEFRLTDTEAGRRLNGEVEVRQGTNVVTRKYRQTMTQDWQPVEYALTQVRANQERSLSLTCENGTARLRGGPKGDREEKAGSDFVILDNGVAAHTQILLHRWRAAKGLRNWTVAIPQGSLFLPGVLTEEGKAQGTLEGRPMDLQVYALEVAGQRIEISAEASTNRLMRVAEPFQSVETLREGFAPAPAVSAAPPPCEETAVKFGDPAAPLPGTLCLPHRNSGKHAAVVFVHGSGEADRDMTAGPNKFFRDLAYGLAAAGVASLRYDKRTFAYPETASRVGITLDREVVDDAIAAIELLHQHPRIDGERVFVAGHSLGAMLAPRIAQRAAPQNRLRGILMLGPGARPFDQLALEQTETQSRQLRRSEEDIRAHLASLRAFFGRLRAGQVDERETLLEAPATYWRELLEIDVAAELRNAPLPVFVAHGGKDIQVGRADHDILLAVLRERRMKLDQAEWLPEHNHLFMKFDGAATAAAYGRRGTVDPALIGRIAKWIAQCGAAPWDKT
ncbi:MAG: alpha/beta hydrolase [Bryobacterales bacterium]|nr:alpha/beta hydrolase [Bryobacterales bacterium]